jgi:hypothetical protein
MLVVLLLILLSSSEAVLEEGEVPLDLEKDVVEELKVTEVVEALVEMPRTNHPLRLAS